MPVGPGGRDDPGRDGSGSGGSRSAVQFDISAPPEWLVCDLAGPDPFRSVPARADSLIARRPDMAPFRDLMVEAVHEHGRGCIERGSLAAGVRYDVSWDGRRSPRFAFGELELIPTVGMGKGEALLGALAAGAGLRHPGDEEPPLVRRVETISGPALRAEYVRALRPGGVRRMGVEYWLPLAGRDSTAHLIFSHGNLDATAVLVADYAYIAGNLSVALRD